MGGIGQPAPDPFDNRLIPVFTFPVAGIRDLIRRNIPLEDHVFRLIQNNLMAFHRLLQPFHGFPGLRNIHQECVDVLHSVLFRHQNTPVHDPDQPSILRNQPVFQLCNTPLSHL